MFSIFCNENRSFSKLWIFVLKYLKWKRSLKVSLEKNLNFRFCFGFLPQRVSPKKFASLRRLSRVLNSQAFRVLRIFTLGTKMPLIWPKDVFEIFLRHFEYWKYTFFCKILDKNFYLEIEFLAETSKFQISSQKLNLFSNLNFRARKLFSGRIVRQNVSNHH